MLEAYQDTSILNSVAANLDNLDFKKVKTKYVKTGWDALSLHGYGKHPLDILKPGVLKSSVNVDTKLQWTTLKDNKTMKPVLDILDKLPCEFERVRFMRLEAGKNIGKHTDKIDKDIGFDDGDIIRIHIHNLKTGHYYYTDVTKAHAVRNTSKVDRIHLVADCYSNVAMRALLNL